MKEETKAGIAKARELTGGKKNVRLGIYLLLMLLAGPFVLIGLLAMAFDFHVSTLLAGIGGLMALVSAWQGWDSFFSKR